MTIQTDPCSGPLHPLALQGIALFNAGEYFEAHEALEAAWREERGPARDLYRGILQVAVAYYHVRRGNYPGAIKVFRRSRAWLALFGDHCRGVDVGRLKQDAAAVEAAVRRLGPERIAEADSGLFKPVSLIPPSQS